MSKDRPKTEPDEVLTMSRVRRLLMKHPYHERVRIAEWLASVASRPDERDLPVPSKPDPRQEDLFS
jgi:hypothetical protein